MLGVEALKAFEEWKKESPGNSINNDTLIIGMSATADPSEYEEAFQYGMHFFCPKPVQCGLLDVLVTKLREASSLNAAVSGLRKDCGIVKELNGLKYL